MCIVFDEKEAVCQLITSTEKNRHEYSTVFKLGWRMTSAAFCPAYVNCTGLVSHLAVSNTSSTNISYVTTSVHQKF